MKNRVSQLVSTIILIALLGVRKVRSKNLIILIISDDHTRQAFGIYGSRLASIRIGQYAQTNGVLDLDGNIPEDRQYLHREMKKMGYETAMIGKWHLKKEPAAFDLVLPGQGKYFDPDFRVQGKKQWPQNVVNMKGHSSDCITDITLDWLKAKRDNSKPFFLMHHYKAPHDMFEFAPRYKDYLEDVFIPEPASMYFNGKNGWVGTRSENDELIRDIGFPHIQEVIEKHWDN